MRLFCWFCFKSVSNELPDDTTVRAVCVCPECVPRVLDDDAEQLRAVDPERATPKQAP